MSQRAEVLTEDIKHYIEARHSLGWEISCILQEIAKGNSKEFLDIMFKFYQSNTFYALQEAVFQALGSQIIDREFFKKMFLEELKGI